MLTSIAQLWHLPSMQACPNMDLYLLEVRLGFVKLGIRTDDREEEKYVRAKACSENPVRKKDGITQEPDVCVEEKFNVSLFLPRQKCAAMNPKRRKGPIAASQMSLLIP